MALYDGFFDGSPVGTHEDGTTKYDREYSASDFYEYFGRFIGSGVCVHNNQDSMKIFLSGNQAVIMPGYLFINGEWLANKAGPDEADYQGYAVTVSATEKTAVLAHLSIGKAMIEILTQPTTQAYPSDSLVLGIVDVANNTVEDTRYNSEICGVIDAASSLTTKIDYAINYIDTEIDAKLAEAEAQINAKSDELESKIEEVRGIVSSVSPPPIGAIKISAAANPGTGWLQCDGSFINESTYPELVALLGKMSVENLDLTEIAGGRLPSDITNSVIYNGRLWVFSYSMKKLYGMLLSDPSSALNVLSVERIDRLSGSGSTIYLSNANGKFFLTQKNTTDGILIFMEKSKTSTSVTMGYFTTADYFTGSLEMSIPYVVYQNGYYHIALGGKHSYSAVPSYYWYYLEFGGLKPATTKTYYTLQSIESPSSSTPWLLIDDCIVSNSIKIEMQVQPLVTTNSQVICGCSKKVKSNDYSMVSVGFSKKNISAHMFFGAYQKIMTDTTFEPGDTMNITIDCVNYTITINGETESLSPQYSGTALDSLGICGLYDSESKLISLASHLRIYSVKIYQKNALSLDLVPCKDPNGVVGLFDIISKSKFYKSKNDSTFIAGAQTGTIVVDIPVGETPDYITTKSKQVNHSLYERTTAPSVTESTALLAFSEKNNNECVYVENVNQQSYGIGNVKINSAESGSYSFTSNYVYNSISGSSLDMQYGTGTFTAYCVPIASTQYLFQGVGIGNNLVRVASLKNNGYAKMLEVPIKLPSSAKTFYDAAVYVSNQDLWVTFVGTGLIISKKLDKADSYGYIDTRPIIGTITRYGNLEYDASSKLLYILGLDDTGTVKVGKLDLTDAFKYSDNGTWLPTLSFGNIPTYIKAKGDGR